MGALGRHDVFVVGKAYRSIDGRIEIEISEVWADFHARGLNQRTNVYSEIRQKDLDAMKVRLVSCYLFEKFRGIEGSA